MFRILTGVWSSREFDAGGRLRALGNVSRSSAGPCRQTAASQVTFPRRQRRQVHLQRHWTTGRIDAASQRDYTSSARRQAKVDRGRSMSVVIAVEHLQSFSTAGKADAPSCSSSKSRG